MLILLWPGYPATHLEVSCRGRATGKTSKTHSPKSEWWHETQAGPFGNLLSFPYDEGRYVFLFFPSSCRKTLCQTEGPGWEPQQWDSLYLPEGEGTWFSGSRTAIRVVTGRCHTESWPDWRACVHSPWGLPETHGVCLAPVPSRRGRSYKNVWPRGLLCPRWSWGSQVALAEPLWSRVSQMWPACAFQALQQEKPGHFMK